MQDKLMQELEISKKVRLALEKEKAENKRLSEALMSSKKANPMKDLFQTQSKMKLI